MIPTVRAALKPTRRAPARPAGDWSDLFARDMTVLDAGIACALSIMNGLQELKTFAREAGDPGLPADEREVQQAAYDEVLAEMSAALAAARIDGLNVLVGEALDGPGDALSALGIAPVLGGDWSLGRPRGSGISVSAADRLDDPAQSMALLEDVLMSFIWASSEYMRLQRAADAALEAYGPGLLKAAKQQQPAVAGRIRRPADGRTARYIAQATQALIAPGKEIANRRPRHLLRLARPPLTQDIERLPGRVETRT